MKTTVDAIVSESNDGQPVDFKVSLTFEGGYNITELSTAKTGYVMWYELDEAEFIAHAILAEVSRARQALATTRQQQAAMVASTTSQT
jgi:hypothetical protein